MPTDRFVQQGGKHLQEICAHAPIRVLRRPSSKAIVVEHVRELLKPGEVSLHRQREVAAEGRYHIPDQVLDQTWGLCRAQPLRLGEEVAIERRLCAFRAGYEGSTTGRSCAQDDDRLTVEP